MGSRSWWFLCKARDEIRIINARIPQKQLWKNRWVRQVCLKWRSNGLWVKHRDRESIYSHVGFVVTWPLQPWLLLSKTHLASWGACLPSSTRLWNVKGTKKRTTINTMNHIHDIRLLVHNEIEKSYKCVSCEPPRLKFKHRTLERLSNRESKCNF